MITKGQKSHFIAIFVSQLRIICYYQNSSYPLNKELPKVKVGNPTIVRFGNKRSH